MKKRLSEKSGFSLIELVVVLAIMSIMTLGTVMSVSALHSHQVRKAARAIDNLLQETKTNVMARGENVYFEISQDADGVYYVTSLNSGASRVLSDNPAFSVTYTLSDDLGDEIPVTEYGPLIISYDKSSGAFLPQVTAVDPDDGSLTFGASYVRTITVTLQSKKKRIVLYPKTGKLEVE